MCLIVIRIEHIPAQPRLELAGCHASGPDSQARVAVKYEIRYELTDGDVVVLRIFTR